MGYAKWKKDAWLFLDWSSSNYYVYYEHNPTTIVHGMILEEKYASRKLDISHLKVFGCIAYVHVPNERRTKLDPKAEKMHLHWLFSVVERVSLL